MLFKLAFIIGTIITVSYGALGGNNTTVLTMGMASYFMIVLDKVFGDKDANTNGKFNIHNIYFILILIVVAILMVLSTKIPGNLYNRDVKIYVPVMMVYATITIVIFTWFLIAKYNLYQSKLYDTQDGGKRRLAWIVALILIGLLLLIPLEPLTKIKSQVEELEILDSNTLKIKEITDTEIIYENGESSSIEDIKESLRANNTEHINECVKTRYIGTLQVGSSVLYINSIKIKKEEIYIPIEKCKEFKVKIDEEMDTIGDKVLVKNN